MDIKSIDREIQFLERMAQGSKWDRFINNPLRYLDGVLWKRVLYKLRGSSIPASVPTIFGRNLLIALPACTDIFLCKGKSHHSEITLVKYLLKNIQSEDVILDIGAHVGYFSVLLSILADKGSVYSFEPSGETFHFLKENAKSFSNMEVFNLPLANVDGKVTFYQFEGVYSEYSSFDIEQYKNEEWFANAAAPGSHELNAKTLDTFCMQKSLHPTFIKLDAEGGEELVLKGGEILFNTAPYPILAMEYLHPNKSNSAHYQAHLLLEKWNYQCHLINERGQLTPLENPEQYMISTGTDSLNLIYMSSVDK